jgi:hypothetical protein
MNIHCTDMPTRNSMQNAMQNNATSTLLLETIPGWSGMNGNDDGNDDIIAWTI